MVDWESVERLRSKGWDWDRIAADENVDFHAEASSGEPGRQLRAIYYQRRSKQTRRSGDPTRSGKSGKLDDTPKWTLARAAWIAVPAIGLWTLLAYLSPSPIGAYLPAYPYLIVALLIAVFALAFALLRTTDRWNTTYRNGAIVGCVLGLVLAGGFGIVAISQGCPTLTPAGSTLPSNGAIPTWTQYSGNPKWTESGMPVFFFYGSIGCPFCSASSWAFFWALERFGTVQGLELGHSSVTDSYSATPELEFVNAQYNSKYVAMHILEADDDSSTAPPTPSSCTDQAYISAYDGGTNGIPFVVVGGQFVHVGTVDDPSVIQPLGLTPSTVLGQVLNQSGSAWNDIAPNAYMLTAVLLKADGGQPATVLSDYPSVAADYNSL
jgi:glutaredoxin